MSDWLLFFVLFLVVLLVIVFLSVHVSILIVVFSLFWGAYQYRLGGRLAFAVDSVSCLALSFSFPCLDEH